MKLKIIVPSVVLFAVLLSCNREHVKFSQARAGDLPVLKVHVHRYGKTLFELDTTHFAAGLKRIQNEYRFFLGNDFDNGQNVQQLLDYVSDTQLISLYHKTIDVYPDVHKLENDLGKAFSRYHYFFPDQTLPGVFSYISDVYYESPVMKKDTVVVIALDDYLGGDFPLYPRLGIPHYRVRCMQKESIAIDVMKALYYDELAPVYKPKTLLDRIVAGGKLLVYLDAVLPDVPDSVKMCYTTGQMTWAINNEKNIWAFMVENNLLYSTDYQMITKLTQDGPFTEGFGKASPSRLGIFMGWQIVTQFMVNNPDVTLEGMINTKDAQTILEKSHYKP